MYVSRRASQEVYVVPPLCSLDGEHDQHHAPHISHVLSAG